MNIKTIFLLLFTIFPFLTYAQITGFLNVPDGILHYKIFGEGPPLLFLNGGPGYSSEGYEGIADQLKSKRQVILFDQRGTGKSKMNELSSKTINSTKMVEDIESLRNHLEIENWDVIGQSFGGVYAMYYANTYPNSINKLILNSTLAPSNERFQDIKNVNHFKGQSIKEEQVIDSIFSETILIVQRKLRTLQMSDSLERIKNEYILDEIRMHRKRVLKARNYVYRLENVPVAIDWFLYKSQYNQVVAILANQSFFLKKIKKKLKKYDKKVLILHGEYDFIKLKAPRMLNKLFPNAQLEIIQNSGHMIWVDQPQVTQKIIFDFLE